MKNLFLINEEEKNRILNLHETATKRHYLSEQQTTGYVIRLTESDLKKTIKKVLLREDVEALPDIRKFPLGKVEDVQQSLIKIGYSGNTGKPITKDIQGCLYDTEKCDGIYGKYTRAAVIKYQKDNGIRPTGNVGPITSKRLGVQQLTSGKPSVKDNTNVEKQNKTDNKVKTQTKAEIVPKLKEQGFTIDYNDFNKDKGYFVTKCKQKQCSEFTGDMLNKTFGDAWHAKENLDVKVNIDANTVKKMETLFNRMNNSGVIPSLEQKTPFDSEAKEIVKKLIPDQSKFQNLPIGTVVGLYYPPSSNYDLAFFQGAIGKTRTSGGELKSIISHPYFCKNLNDCKNTVWTEKDLGRKNKFVAGNTLKSGESFAPVTHLGFIGYKDKNGVPYIVHNIKHDVYAFPTNKLNTDGLQIIWSAKS
jgi:peptidoglycan hydrolase-like protein with peptidoglycan-binding domain